MRHFIRAMVILSLICSISGIFYSAMDKSLFEFSGWFSSGMWTISFWISYRRNQ